MLEAFEKYYHKDVVMEEATGEVRKGRRKPQNLKRNLSALLKNFICGC